MSIGLRLSEYATTPLYNIKAVVQATNITPSTLRAWERRYNIASPQRSDSGYRLYSERDIALIRWLKAQVDAGMSISQAVSWYSNLLREAGELDEAVLPARNTSSISTSLPQREIVVTTPQTGMRDLNSLARELIRALANFNEEEAEKTIAEAFAIYPFEQVGEELLMATIHELKEQREQGTLSTLCETFANNYLLQRLAILLHATPKPNTNSLLWLACAPTEKHEAGALLLAIYLRRAGYAIHYIGKELPTSQEAVAEFVQEAKRLQTAMLILYASTYSAAEQVSNLAAQLAQSGQFPAQVGYSGAAYTQNSVWHAPTPGIYLGSIGAETIQKIAHLLVEQHSPEKIAEKKRTEKRSDHSNEERKATKNASNRHDMRPINGLRSS